jgi:hypothetical protein
VCELQNHFFFLFEKRIDCDPCGATPLGPHMKSLDPPKECEYHERGHTPFDTPPLRVAETLEIPRFCASCAAPG